MAVYLGNGVQVTVNSVDLSTYVTSVTLNRSMDELEITAMGDSGHKFVAGLEASSVTIDFLNDWASAKVGQTLDTLMGTTTTVTMKPGSGVTSATNPLYTFSVLVNNITPINGGVGDLATQSVTWNVSGTIVKTTA
jgi:hypothetical protein